VCDYDKREPVVGELLTPQFAEIQRSQSSVEISTNGKGEKSWKVKAYADTIDEAIRLAVEADKKVADQLKSA